MSGHTSVFWECLPITRPCESRGRVMLESTNHASIVSIYGGNVETGLLASVVGQFVDGLGAGCSSPVDRRVRAELAALIASKLLRRADPQFR